jgi:hypothetical protein
MFSDYIRHSDRKKKHVRFSSKLSIKTVRLNWNWNYSKAFVKLCRNGVVSSDSLQAGRFGDQVSAGRDFTHQSRRPWGPPRLLHNGYRGSFPRVKQPGRCVHYPSPSSAKVKNEWSYTSTSLPISAFMDCYTENFKYVWGSVGRTHT